MTDIACILLAAGTGSRFGGDKLLYPLNGKPMAAHAIELHASLPYACRILVTQRRHTAIASLAESNGFLIGYNEAPERGIASSIRIAMELLALQPCPLRRVRSAVSASGNGAAAHRPFLCGAGAHCRPHGKWAARQSRYLPRAVCCRVGRAHRRYRRFQGHSRPSGGAVLRAVRRSGTYRCGRPTAIAIILRLPQTSECDMVIVQTRI